MNVTQKEFPPLTNRRQWPLLRVRVLADGWPSGTTIVRADPAHLQTVYIPPEGNVAWANASTDVRLMFTDIEWMDDRILLGKVALYIDARTCGEYTPFNLLICDNFCAPCGIVHFAKRVAEYNHESTRIETSNSKVHNYSVVFDHYGD